MVWILPESMMDLPDIPHSMEIYIPHSMEIY